MLKKVIFLFALVLILVLAKNWKIETKQSGNSTVSPKSSTEPGESFSLILSSQNNSNQNGIVTIEEKNSKTKISIKLTGPQLVSLPAGLYKGSCSNPGTLLYSLDNINSSESETLLGADLETLKKDAPLIIAVSKSNEERNVFTSCGNLLEK